MPAPTTEEIRDYIQSQVTSLDRQTKEYGGQWTPPGHVLYERAYQLKQLLRWIDGELDDPSDDGPPDEPDDLPEPEETVRTILRLVKAS
jgi:hypothetical protein